MNIDFIGETLSDKRIILRESNAPFAKAVAAKIFKELGCEVHIVKDLNSLKKVLGTNDSDFFVGVFDYSKPADIDAVEFAIDSKLPVIVLAQELDNDDTRDLLSSLNIVDYVLKRSIEDIDFLVRLIRQLAKNSHTEVLVADDSSVYRKNLSSILKTQLFTVYEAKDGAEALSLVKKHKNIKMVLTDYFMPNIDGFELVTKLRKLKTKDELAIIAISGDAGGITISKFLKYGADDYIKKPFNKDELVCRINNNMEHIYLIETQKELLNFDFLSGLHNKKYLLEAGGTLHANSLRGNIDFIVGMIDIDDFKSINDRYGHDVGDMVIKDLALRLKDCFRKSDIVCRFGGEEFCVVLTNVEDKFIDSTFEKLLHSVRSAKIITKNNEVASYTISIGVCATLMDSFEGMLKVADEKLYVAKKEGKNRVVTDIIPS